MKAVKEYLVPTATLCVICLIAAFLLGLTNNVTAGRIAELAVQAEAEARMEVLPSAKSFGEGIEDAASGCTYAEAFDENGNSLGYAVTAIGEGGYGGKITAMVGINADGTVNLVSILDQSETASIGGKLMSQDSFLNRFIGLSGSAALKKNGGTVDAVTGATKTSTGITNAVNNALACVQGLKGEVSADG